MAFESKPMRRYLSLVGAAILLLAAQSALAQWKWKDAQGQTHVSDTPPPREVLDKDILQRPNQGPKRSAPAPTSASASASAASAPKVDAELEARKAKADAEQKAKNKAEEDKLAALRAENCQRARQQVTTLQSGQRIARINAKGEREFLDDQARSQELQAAQRVVASDCK